MAYIGNQAAVKLEQKQYAECEALCKSAIDVGRANRAPYEDIAKVRMCMLVTIVVSAAL
jgi:stress-induced-phosphoprotein 1